MKVMVIPVVVGALNTITKGLIKELEDLEIRGQMETIQTTALLRSTKTEEYWTLEVVCCHPDCTRREKFLNE